MASLFFIFSLFLSTVFVFVSISTSASISSLDEDLPPSPCLHPHLLLLLLLLLTSSSPSPTAFFTSPGHQRRPVDRIGSPTQVLPQLAHRHHLLNWTNKTSAYNWVGVQSSSSSSSTSVDGGQTVVSVALPRRGLVGSIPSHPNPSTSSHLYKL